MITEVGNQHKIQEKKGEELEIIQETQGRERGREVRERGERTRAAQFQVTVTVTHIFTLQLQSFDSLLESTIIFSPAVASSV